MKLGSLHARLASTLLVLLALAGAWILYSTLTTTELYLQEVNQSMNLDLASNIARMKHQELLSPDGELRKEGIERLLHWMMVVNPGPQFYLLDLQGNVLAYDPMAGDVLQDRVDVAPIHRFLDQRLPSGQDRRTVLGDDPRAPGQRKVFSASRIPPEGPADGRPEGSPAPIYLYVVLASQHLDSAAERLRDSYILRLSFRNGLAYLAVVLLSGLLVFGRLTRPLRRLTARMRQFQAREPEPGAPAAAPAGDEVKLLDQTFEDLYYNVTVAEE